MVSFSKVILTGATGWLGSRLVAALTTGLNELGPVGAGEKVVKCLVKPGENPQKLLELEVEVHYGDITDPEACYELLRDGEGSLVIHTAGLIHPKRLTKEFETVNINGTMALFKAVTAAKASKFVFVSSNSSIGSNTNIMDRFTEQSPYNPYMGYGRSKHAIELALLSTIKHENSPAITIVRPPWFYGPGQPPRQTEFFQMIKDGKFPLMGRGLNLRSMVFIDSLVLGVLLAGYTPKASGEIYWIADMRPYSMFEIINTVKEVLRYDFGIKVNLKNLYVPAFISDLARIADGALQSVGRYNQKLHVLSELNQTIACDITKAINDLGFQPICELREGMRRSVDWCLKQGQHI